MSFIYFIQSTIGGPIKIGRSADVAARLAAFQIGCPFPLRVLCQKPGSHAEERILHRRYAHECTGGEWFLPSDDLRSMIEGLGGSVTQAALWTTPAAVSGRDYSRRRYRTTLGPCFSEGARQLWIRARERGWNSSRLNAELQAGSGTISKILYGDRGAGRGLASRIEVKLGIDSKLWDEQPTEPFVPNVVEHTQTSAAA